MNLFDLFVRVGVDDQASKQVAALSQNLGAGLKKAAAIGTAAVGAAAAGYVALTKNAINQYKEYEQLVGGVDTLFADSAESVIENASRAFLTAGMSANQYMSTVTSFAASLKQSLGGDVVVAAELADLALRDMSDNANKMGTDIGMIQNAYSGFARQSYVMLDNLKLGYAGTQAEMRRLIRDAAALDDSIDANSMSFANVVRAINVVQTELGITGTTSKEAATTIEGSTAAAKAAWENLAAGLADDEADIDALVMNFADSVMTVGENLIPRVARVGESVIGLIKNYGNVAINQVKANAPVWWDKVQMYVADDLPEDISAAKQFAQRFLDNASTWIENDKNQGSIREFVRNFGNAIIGDDNGLEKSAINFASSFADFLISPDTFDVIDETVEKFGERIGETAGYAGGKAISLIVDSVKEAFTGSGDDFFKKWIKNMASPLYSLINGVKQAFGQDTISFDEWYDQSMESWKSSNGRYFTKSIFEEEYTAPQSYSYEPQTVVHEHNINMSVESTGDGDIDDIVEEAAGRAASYIQEKLDQRKAVVYG